jgi:hypothetical protein
MKRTALLAVMVGAVTAAGCGSGSGSSGGAAAGHAVTQSLTTSVSTGTATWGILVMGGSAASEDNFWQLFTRPAGSVTWKLVTPPGVADNGGLVTAGSGSKLTVAFVPNALLRFTPLAITTNEGAHWTQGLLNSSLTAAPSALARLPNGRVLAITSKGVEQSARSGGHWTTLVTRRTLAASSAGRKCGLTALTSVAVSKSGGPLLAGACDHPGVAYVVEQTPAGWVAVASTLTGAMAKRPVTVLQMVSGQSGANLLLAVRSGHGQLIVPAWLPAHLTTLTIGKPFVTRSKPVSSTYFSATTGMGVVLAGTSAQATVPGARNGLLEAKGEIAPRSLPAPGATLAFQGAPTSGQFTAFVPGLDTVQVWQWTNGSWHRTQLISVPSQPA